MLTYEDCRCMSDLTQDEIDIVARHEHCGQMQAIAEADRLLHEHGEAKLYQFMLDEAKHAHARGQIDEELKIIHTMAEFVRTHNV